MFLRLSGPSGLYLSHSLLHRALKLIGLMLLSALILLVSAIPLGLGLIWSIPMIGTAYGIVYREMFGVQEVL